MTDEPRPEVEAAEATEHAEPTEPTDPVAIKSATGPDTRGDADTVAPPSPPAMAARASGALALPLNAPIVTLAVLMTVLFLMFLLIEPTPRWVVLFGGAIAALSMDGVLRSARRVPFEDGADTAPYLFLPALFAIAVPVFAEHNVRDFWAAPAALAAGLAFGAISSAEVASVRQFDPARGTARFIASAATYFVAFALYSLTYRFGLDLQTAMVAVALVSALLAVELLHEGEVDPLETLIFAVVTALTVAEVRWALHFLPLDGYLAGLTLVLAFYLVTGLIHSHLVRQLTATLAAEYTLIAAAGVALVVWARAQGLA
ncbi:MAG: hypothetical protein V3R95_05425 [Dehalococcoidia bacterium]